MDWSGGPSANTLKDGAGCRLNGGPEPSGEDDARIGRVVAGGQYRVLRRLGSGGFGVVYEVETVIGRLRRALKVLNGRWVSDGAMREQFVNEALILEQVNHPNVARCYAAGILGAGGEPYLLFELIDGVDLERAIRSEEGQGGRFEPLRAVRIAKQIASGLVAAHTAGVLHRDLKPANVLVVRAGRSDEQAKLADFGLAKVTEYGSTATENISGTPQFMAPEQFTPGARLDPRVDLWQLGAILFFLLTGRPPYRLVEGEGPFSILAQQQRHAKAGPAPGEVVPRLSSYFSLNSLVARLLAGEPSERPGSAAEVCAELVAIEQSLSPSPALSGSETVVQALCARPSASGWSALCRHLQMADTEPALVDVAERSLEDWPDEWRAAPCGWWEAVRRGDRHPLWRLARVLDLSGRGLGDEEVRQLAENPAVASLRQLSLAGNKVGNSALAALAASPHLTQLEQLDLSHNRLTSAGVELLSKSSRLSALKSLNLAFNGIGARGAAALAASGLRPIELHLSYNDIRTEGAVALAGSEAVANLKVLRLAGNRIGPDGAAALAMSPHLKLEELDLAHNGIGAHGAAALALSKNAAHLRILLLAHNELGRQGLRTLLGSSGFESLEELDLSANRIGAAGALDLASSPFMRRLHRLRLADNDLGDAGLATLLSAPNSAGLRALDVSQNDLSHAGAGLLSGGHPQLEELDLSRNPLGNEGAVALGEALARMRVRSLRVNQCGFRGEHLALLLKGAAGRLRVLEASGNHLGETGAAALVRLPQATCLVELNLADDELGPGGASALVSAAKLASLVALNLDSNAIGDEGASALVRSSAGLPALERLSMADNDIGVDGALALACSTLAARLNVLDLAHNRLGDSGAEAVAFQSWPGLRELRLADNGVGFAGVASLLGDRGLSGLLGLDVTHNAQVGLLDLHSLSRDRVALMESSFALLSAQGADFAERFYDELFARYPHVKGLFAQTDMRRQQGHLMAALVMVIENLRNPDGLEQRLADLGQRHLAYGVLPSHYYALCSTLLDSIRDSLGKEWTPEIHGAWSDGLEAIARVMMNSQMRMAGTGRHPAPAASEALPQFQD